MRVMKLCGSVCDYESYYLVQAGKGKSQIEYYKGVPFQRGYNIFLKYGQRYGIPVLKYLAKTIFNTGQDIVKDIVSGEDPKSAVIKNLKQKASETLQNLAQKIDQSGSGKRKRKCSNKRKKCINSVKKLKKSPKRKPSEKKSLKRVRKTRDIFNIKSKF